MKTKIAALAILSACTLTTTAAIAESEKFSQWAPEHPLWVHLHPDRDKLFSTHPDIADKDRSEWSNWSERENFKDWAACHPGWVEKNHSKADWMSSHPQDSQVYKYRSQWVEHRESKSEFNEWLKKHQWQNVSR